jgi:hypothetical protein
LDLLLGLVQEVSTFELVSPLVQHLIAKWFDSLMCAFGGSSEYHDILAQIEDVTELQWQLTFSMLVYLF